MALSDDDKGAAAESKAGRDWPGEAAARVESFVELLRDKSVRPVMRIVTFVIYSFALLFLLVAILALLSVATVRLLDVFAFGGRVWASDAVLGGIFTLGGMFAISRRNPSGEKA